MKTLILPPDPERAIMGLRDTGYTFNTAIADIVDNSIAANATTIRITASLNYDASGVTLYIADDGDGMDEKGLVNAMKYGSERRKDPNSLGKFGLGLKTASTAFCTKLSLISKTETEQQVRKVQWDLYHVAEKNEWELLFPDVTDDELMLLEQVAVNNHGTLVVWENVDRLLNKSYASTSGAKAAFTRKIESLSQHLSMVFQRFLDHNYEGAPNICIYLNEEIIKPWDPFCLNEPSTTLVADNTLEIGVDDSDSNMSVNLKAYILPRKEDFSSKENMISAKISNDRQGFYVYRENRLIHYGDWMGMMSNEPHLSLLRIDFSFDHNFDELLNVDIKKSGIQLIPEVYDKLVKNFLPAPRREAITRYRNAVQNHVNKVSLDAHKGSNTSIENKAHSCEESIVTPIGKDEAIIRNAKAEFKHKISILSASKPGEVRIVPVEELEGGQLWEPAIVDGNHAIKLNKSHEFYKKIYYPVLNDGFTVIGMDSLLWALGEAELSTINPEVAENYETLRYQTSKFLKKLLIDLPEPEIE